MQHVMPGSLRVSPIGPNTMSLADTCTSGGGLDDAESIRSEEGGA
ncbi:MULTISPECIES: hypothetical protein [unclassified Streptomyces]|nr:MULTISPECIES: hypothetical protein [unclassified Streptomyces]MCX5563023.1 hypothetical protein [Streptomyces sp. NBC_00038]WRZ17235.1 hypothetical protein OHT59_01430 [Streptomyces sp. NBC_00243]